ncbi:type III-B CRISPR-associated protein Cas10/Cmr2 [Thermococcus sp. 18S1]|uniref:type III-B CRISPR-associated protein Cas10/Cmr2 n=1 Tax=Thermococcus sp. 18S1 TaxID=1638210 RepID=UPI00143AC511|nr:type III-B CRISPR-associated protein Cas10/Cmr2 [Thermococcus sp. 18S1]NJE31235.1 type III-B CRISPR-associated protein Cas10/Cmr2 [Thermococcus sp. 18S1]
MSRGFNALFDFAPSVLLAGYLGLNPDELFSDVENDKVKENCTPKVHRDYKLWESLSIVKINGKPEKLLLKHPISARDKELSDLQKFIDHLKESGKLEDFLKVLRREELELMCEAREKSVEEVWNVLPEALKNRYHSVIKEFAGDNSFDLSKIAEELVHFPAEPAFPDHDWLSRAEIYATLNAIKEESKKPYLLRFKISPVQAFIGNARKELDFWAGSHLLSRLTYEAIKAIKAETGPWAIIFPHLREQPFFEAEFKVVEGEKYDVPNMPNKVLAVIGIEEGREKEFVENIQGRITGKINGFLGELLNEAWKRYEIEGLLSSLGVKGEDELEVARKVLNSYFNVTVRVYPYEELKLERVHDEKMREIIETLSGDGGGKAVYYPYLFAVLDQITDFASVQKEKEPLPPGFKCTVCGELPAIGQLHHNTNHNYPAERVKYRELRRAWEDHVKKLHSRGIYDIKDGEMLCPLCLVKRVYPKVYLNIWEGKNVKREGKRRVESVSEVALRRSGYWSELYERAKIEYNTPGERLQCVKKYPLHKRLAVLFRLLGSPNSEAIYPENLSSLKSLLKIYGRFSEAFNDAELKEEIERCINSIREEILEKSREMGEPPRYYAMLKMDGDNMGKVISGEKGVKMLKDYLAVDASVPNVKRPVTPTTHVAITRSLSNFAVNFVPKIIQDDGSYRRGDFHYSGHRGELILAGGDDVFALLPADTVIDAAHQTQEAFRKDWMGFDYLQGSTRSMSAGILVLHYKEPLYHAYRLVSELEETAKYMGRNAVALGYLTHSGNFYRVVLNWEPFSENSCTFEVLKLLDSEGGVSLSSKFIYELYETVDIWPVKPEAIEQLLRFELNRHVSGQGDEKKKVVESTLQNLLWTASHVRVKLGEKELKSTGLAEKVSVEELNEKILQLVSIDPEKPDDLGEHRGTTKFWVELAKELQNSLPLDKKEAEAFAGIVMKKQLKGASMLLRILSKMGVVG